MRYIFIYKTSDAVRHEDSIEAACRDEVFARLRERGIRPIKVLAADGSKANGELRGIRKRVVFLIVLFVSALVGLVSFVQGEKKGVSAASDVTSPTPRHQIYGDPAILDAFERGDFLNVFDNRGDELLAWFAQPGKMMCPSQIDSSVCDEEMARAISDALSADIRVSESDGREIVELKQIVMGMRLELQAYLSNGNGTIYSYWRRLNERLVIEQQIYDRVYKELQSDVSEEFHDERNSALRRMGLQTIPRKSAKQKREGRVN